jgi:pyruvate dehydrogenase E1 component
VKPAAVRRRGEPAGIFRSGSRIAAGHRCRGLGAGGSDGRFLDALIRTNQHGADRVHRHSVPPRLRAPQPIDREWIESLDRHRSPGRRTRSATFRQPIPVDQQPVYPGSREIERRIKSYVRWNAMAMVVRANRQRRGHRRAHFDLCLIGDPLRDRLQPLFPRQTDSSSGDQIYFQGHAAPGIYARAYLEGRIDATSIRSAQLPARTGRRDGGLSSYPHPWLMPEFWQFPTVSMGLGPINSIYQARFNRYLEDRGLLRTQRLARLGVPGRRRDGRARVPGRHHPGLREQLDNLTWVVNCNLQRLDGPVRGNGNIIQELEAAFRGAGWNVIKVIWGSDWDPLFAADRTGTWSRRMADVFRTASGSCTVSVESARTPRALLRPRPGLAELVAAIRTSRCSTWAGRPRPGEGVRRLRRRQDTGSPTVILARTIKGYGLGEAGEGRNITHQQKKLNEQELRPSQIASTSR